MKTSNPEAAVPRRAFEGTALITGASAGIGFATAMKLASHGYDLILAARREDRLQSAAGAIASQHGVDVLPVVVDIRSKEAVAEMFARNDVSTATKKLSVIVSNAGLAAGVEPMPTASIEDWDRMIETNLSGLLYVIRYGLKSVIENRGHIVNIGSVAGHRAYPGGGVYCATKAAVKMLSEALRLDLQGTGVRVTNIEPGMVETEFSKVRLGDDDRARAVYQGMTPLSAADIAETIAWCLARPAHVNVQELLIYPTDQAGVGFVRRRV